MAVVKRSFSRRCGASLAGTPAYKRRCRRQWRRCRSRAHGGIAAVHFGCGEAGVYMGRIKLPSLPQHLARGAKIDQHGAVVVGDENIGWLDVQVQHLVLVHDAQTAQNFVKQRTDGGLAETPCRA